MNNTWWIWSVIGTACWCCGCAEDRVADGPATSIPVAAATTDPAPEAPSGEPTEKRFEGIVLTVPAGWTEKPPASEFIQAEFQLPGPVGPARLTMSSTGGGLNANLDRWRGQIQAGPDDPAPQEETVHIDGRDAVILDLTGRFQDQSTGGAMRPDYTLLGAAIPTGPAHFFLKVTGPRSTVMEHRAAFKQMVATARLDD